MRQKFEHMMKFHAGAMILIGIFSSTFIQSMSAFSDVFATSFEAGFLPAFFLACIPIIFTIIKDAFVKPGGGGFVRGFVGFYLSIYGGFVGVLTMARIYGSATSVDWITCAQWFFGCIVFPVVAFWLADAASTNKLAQANK